MGVTNCTHSTHTRSRFYSAIPRPDAPVIYAGAFPILTARCGRRSIYNTGIEPRSPGQLANTLTIMPIYIYIYIYNGCPLGFERDHLLYLMYSPLSYPPLCVRRWLFRPAKLRQILPQNWHNPSVLIAVTLFGCKIYFAHLRRWLRPAIDRHNFPHMSQLAWWLCGPCAGPYSPLRIRRL